MIRHVDEILPRTHPDRFTEHYFFNTIGHPLEETIRAGRLIFDGVMQRHPGLEIVFAHGGGFLPAYAGRFDHAYHAARTYATAYPSTQRVSGPVPLRHDGVRPRPAGIFVRKYGAGRVLLGTDYPYDMGESYPLGSVGRVEGINPREVELITGGNAARLLGIEHEKESSGNA